VIALELLATGQWAGKGILGPEAFDSMPFLTLMTQGHGQPFGIRDSQAQDG
jgi:saccharopine dehydrogenase-like NADP-dependent oxidoreductase